MSIAPRPDPRRAALDAAAWLPDSWATPAFTAASTTSPLDDAADFIAGWDVTVASVGTPAPSDTHAALDVLLPEFGAGRHGPGTRGRAADADRAADEREAAVRAELFAEFAAELDARDAAHAAALDEVWREGHAAGIAAAEAAAHDALDATVRTLDAAVHEVRTHEERWMGDLRAHIAGLAVAVAHHVIGHAVAADDAFVVALATRAIAEFPVAEALAARVHPADLDALKHAWERAPRDGAVRWIPDARVARGGALVEGRERIVDGRVDAALERLYRALAGQAA